MSQPSPHKLFSARLKIERAKEHIENLHSAKRAFFDTDPYEVGPKRDPQSGDLTFYVERVEPVPPRIACLAGDAIHNLRCALDHLAYALFLAGTGGSSNAQFRQTYFPISSSAAKYKTESRGKVKGMRQNAIDAIDAIEPYKGGKGHQLWVLNELNNADKHRLLITIVSICSSFDLGERTAREVRRDFERQGLQSDLIDSLIEEGIRKIPMRPFNPTALTALQVGHKLVGFAAGSEPNEDLEFAFDIAISEPEIIEGKSLIVTLHQLGNLVDHLVTAFEPVL
jgi:hypothetical protein